MRPIQLSFASAYMGICGSGKQLKAQPQSLHTFTNKSCAMSSGPKDEGSLQVCSNHRHSGLCGCCTLDAQSSCRGIRGHLAA